MGPILLPHPVNLFRGSKCAEERKVVKTFSGFRDQGNCGLRVRDDDASLYTGHIL